MNIFEIHKNIIDNYESFIKSFINIHNKKIHDKIQEELNSKKLWPDPLIQFNPNYETGESFNNLVTKNNLNPEIKNIFGDYKLYKHQAEAIKLGTAGKDFIVTSGTGSGKSLTFLATIFNRILNNNPGKKGVRAIIVYPMNALINSQSIEIEKFRNNYKDSLNKDCPINFAQYTGQEDELERNRIREELPHIILTNYMMLELILTRSTERSFRESVFDDLEFLVFDELHTYRGRQGSDVSMLIRRIKNNCSNKLICMGTSATMISDENSTTDEKKKIVAEVVSKIFGDKFDESQIINEYLTPSLGNFKEELNPEEIKKCLIADINISDGEKEFENNCLAKWIERKIALELKDKIYVRRKPLNLESISKELELISGIEKESCKIKISELLKWASVLNLRENKSRNYLPFKLHQFISQTGTVYVTLGNDENQYITLDPGVYKFIDNENKSIYPVVFSRMTGAEFICVYKNKSKDKLEPREFKINYDEDEKAEGGYLIPDLSIWNPDDNIDDLPDSYFNIKKDETRKIKKEYVNRIPQKLFYDESGNYSEKHAMKYEGWYMPAKLLFDPSSGTFFDTKTNEGTKLTKLGSEGRSTSTTVLSFSILKNLADNEYGFEDQKLLSFTDNRQDAALQSGHFNDFLDVIKLRSAIYFALKNSTNINLDFTTLPDAIFNSLNLNQTEYAISPGEFPASIKDNENAFKEYLMHRAIYDLRRGWRVILPNLEQCALLEIDYAQLKENCEFEEAWKDLILLQDLDIKERMVFIYEVLDFFRKEYAIHSENYLTSEAIKKNRKIIFEKLKDPWKFDRDEDINEPFYLRLETLPDRIRIFHKSIGYNSSLGKYIKKFAKDHRVNFNMESYMDFMTKFLKKLSGAGWINIEELKSNDRKVNIYQLNLDKIIWKIGNEKNIKVDLVKQRSYKNYELKPNIFFQSIYKIDFKKYKTFKGNVHTGQNSNEERQLREAKFREGVISALYCSPTMELGIDISTLNVVHMRNAPPNPSNYAQRSGRAGRSGQAALVFTYCSGFSPHDVHYFKNSAKMVAGNVVPPRLEINNEELLKTHLNAVYLSELNLNEINLSICDLIDETNKDMLLLNEDVNNKLKISDKQKDSLLIKFKKVIKDFESDLKIYKWFNDDWIKNGINRFPESFNNALDRWRSLYRSAISQLSNATNIINSGTFTTNHEQMKAARRNQYQGNIQLDLLKNKTGSNTLSEFYPYRYLASEGFLPGYNFTRLPLRTYIPVGNSGAYVSRPRFLALKEFGPGNLIYHNGSKYRIEQLLKQDIENSRTEAKIVNSSGYFLEGAEKNFEICPLTEVALNNTNSEIITQLLEMSETRTEEQNRISCEEEERLSHGYEMKTYFSIPAGIDTVVKARVKNADEDFLNLRFIPTAKLTRINKKWKVKEQDGFLIGLSSGLFKKDSQRENSNEPLGTVKLFTTDTADSLYIEPIKSLALTYEGVLTLQYALKRAIESLFQIESNEIGVELMGDKTNPNIFLYEASEGSLGILSQFVEDKAKFNSLILEAIKICRYDDENYKEPASYDDLLSYYNQQFHKDIDRFLIRDALDKLKICEVELLTTNSFSNYEEHYKKILSKIDKNSSTELKFLNFLHDRGLRLPDDAQRRVNGIYSQPDFYYNPGIHVFCDGSPHDDPENILKDTTIRDVIRNSGEEVVIYYYKDSLEELISKRSDIFKKVK